jgi:predicted dinucleotide-binding enzyme
MRGAWMAVHGGKQSKGEGTMAARVGVIGSGEVGETLANGFLKHGHEVMRGTREQQKLAEWKANAGPSASVGTVAEAAAFGALVVLSVKGGAAEAVVRACGAALDGKTVIDTTNAIGDEPPDHGILRMFTGPNESLMERLQRAAPLARFVKSFSCVGNEFMVNPDFGGEKPTMFLCGNDAAAKAEVEAILAKFGWEWQDIGGVEGARAIEPLAVLWCAPGFLRNEWSHAYRVLRK